MNAKEFLGEELYAVVEKLFIKVEQSSKESNEVIVKVLREEASNLENKKASLLFNKIADCIEKNEVSQ